MSSSLVRVVRADHERLPRLLRRLVTPGPSQARWHAELLQLLRAHRAAEEAVLGRAVTEAVGPAAAVTATELDALDAELGRTAEALADEQPGSARVRHLGATLAGLLERHTALTERQLGLLQGAVPRKEVRRLGEEYATLRDEMLREEGAAEPPPRRLDLPRAELYEMARRAGIEGRSAMSRAALVEALLRHQEHQRT